MVQLKDHSVFVCFAPKEDPKIVVAVIVENGGFGATWAGPMAYLMVEKYLNDTLRADRVKEVERIAAANLMPGYLPRLQYKEDSTRAMLWFNRTGDSAILKRFWEKTRHVGPYVPPPDRRRPAANRTTMLNPRREPNTKPV